MDRIRTILVTNDPRVADDAQAAGISRIMVDLESMGKKERQASRTTFISTHRREDIAPVRKVLVQGELIVRVNPWHAGSAGEVDDAIGQGADIVMLPMITQLEQVEAFVKQVNGRAQALPLVETAYSMQQVGAIAANPAIKEIYIGLNDLHLSLGMDFLFEPLAEGLLDRMAESIHAQGKPFGFGGMAMIGSGELPAERILAEHARLGSSCVILSSRFCKDVQIEQAEGRRQRLAQAVQDLNDAWESLKRRTPEQQREEAAETHAMIRALAAKLREKRQQA